MKFYKVLTFYDILFFSCILRQSSQTQPQTQSQKNQSAEVYAPLTSVKEAPLQVPQPEGEAKKFSLKIENLVNEITKLNLIEVGELSDLLKKRLNLPDAPLMPMGGFSPVPVAAEVIDLQTVPLLTLSVLHIESCFKTLALVI
jgi:hypothetical protein